MKIREKMRELGNGIYKIKTSKIVYVGSYGMMGYNKETYFELIIKDGNIYSQNIYKTVSYDRNNKQFIKDKNEKIKLVNNILEKDYMEDYIEKFDFIDSFKGDSGEC